MPGPGLFALAVVGLLAGVLARGLVGRRLSLFASLLTGVAGALIGVMATEALGLPAGGLGVLAVAALAGSTLLLSLFALLIRR